MSCMKCPREIHTLTSFSLLSSLSFLLSVQTCSGVDGTPHLTAAIVSVSTHPSLPIHSSADAPLMLGHTHLSPGVPVIARYANVWSLAVGNRGFDKQVLYIHANSSVVCPILLQWWLHQQGDDIGTVDDGDASHSSYCHVMWNMHFICWHHPCGWINLWLIGFVP